MMNVEKVAAARGRRSGFVIGSSFVIRLPRRSWAKAGHSSFSVAGAFTMIELLVVIAIIFILAGLVLSTVGYVRKKGARARAETEIAAISAACESYKADNATYPFSPDTNSLDARTNFDPSGYSNASLSLYEKLMGVTTGNRSEIPSGKTYMT